METKDKDGNVVVAPVIETGITAHDDSIDTKMAQDLENYRKVALKRLGKLPGDADFLEGADKATGLTVEEMVKKTLLEGEYARRTAEKDANYKAVQKELSELKLAIANRPETSTGGNGSDASTVGVKDNVFNEAQIAELTVRAARLKVDPQKFIENAKKTFLANR